MKKNYRKRYLPKSKSTSYEKKFFIKVVVCVAVLAVFFTVSNIKSEKLDLVKMYISNTLEESTDFNGTKKAIIHIFSNLKDKFSYNRAVPVDNFKDTTETPMVSLPSSVLTVNAKEEKLSFQNPAKGTISSPYGMRIHPVENTEKFHGGIDIAGKEGSEIFPAAFGKVEKVSEDNYNGKYVVISHKDNFQTTYSHLKDITVKNGDEVNLDTVIGTMGSTGMTTGVNLHFEIKLNGERVDPKEYVSY